MAQHETQSARTGRRYSTFEEQLLRWSSKILGGVNTWLFRVSGGRIGGRFLYGAPVMLLTTIGQRTGQRRTAPVLYLEDTENLVTVASKAGSAHDPRWYRNLVANPDVEVEIGGEHRSMRARTASADEKLRLWPHLTKMYPPYDTYQKRTDREIPVVILEPPR